MKKADYTCRYCGHTRGKHKPNCSECKCSGFEPVQVQAGEWIQPRMRKYGLICCDCGLKHLMDFRIYKGKIQFRAFRHD